MAGRFDDILNLNEADKSESGSTIGQSHSSGYSSGDPRANFEKSSKTAEKKGVFNPASNGFFGELLENFRSIQFLPTGTVQEAKRQAHIGLTLAVALFVFFTFLALYSFDPFDPSFNTASNRVEMTNFMGSFGAMFSDVLLQTFGYMAWLVPVVSLSWLVFVCIKGNQRKFIWRLLALPFSLLCLAGVVTFLGFDTSWHKPSSAGGAGGILMLDMFSGLTHLPRWLVAAIFLIMGSIGVFWSSALPGRVLHLFAWISSIFAATYTTWRNHKQRDEGLRHQVFDEGHAPQFVEPSFSSVDHGHAYDFNVDDGMQNGFVDGENEQQDEFERYGPDLNLNLEIQERWSEFDQAAEQREVVVEAEEEQGWQHFEMPADLQLDVSYGHPMNSVPTSVVETTNTQNVQQTQVDDFVPDTVRVEDYAHSTDVEREAKPAIEMGLDTHADQNLTLEQDSQADLVHEFEADDFERDEFEPEEYENEEFQDDDVDEDAHEYESIVPATVAPSPTAPSTLAPAPTPVASSLPAEKLQKKSKPAPAPLPEQKQVLKKVKRYNAPSLEILTKPSPAESERRQTREELEENAELLTSVLSDFGVKGQITNVRPGPVVTLYELKPAPGTKTSRVVNLADDIARSMSAFSARIATVPGRNVIGIELPNPNREMVLFREMLEVSAYKRLSAKLPIALGKDIGGSPVYVDLAKMPHLLVAGTTGSGKSVAINTMILSLLYSQSPDRCKFIMIDPKMLELSVYDGIPHLLSPVVTEPKKAVVALNWAVREMEERYKLMSNIGVRNIDGFNKRMESARKDGEILKRKVQTGFDVDTGAPVYEEQEIELNPLPFIVVVVDEMADLMLVAGKDIEAALQRLAQMARAAGIHIIMATQRPSVDVITGTIKANFPTRISFSVTSKIDSRTILGEMGAEQLLGQGDMLYMPNGGRIQRVHGPFASDDEVELVVKHLKEMGEPEYIEAITAEVEEMESDPTAKVKPTGDDLYDQAVAVVLREKKASTSFVQRHLQIGYNRAARLIEQMESEGLISAADRVGRRQILAGNQGEDVL